jgi:hypothetical protein
MVICKFCRIECDNIGLHLIRYHHKCKKCNLWHDKHCTKKVITYQPEVFVNTSKYNVIGYRYKKVKNSEKKICYPITVKNIQQALTVIE